jgi:toxin-antitoxin system PIN domain toxin
MKGFLFDVNLLIALAWPNHLQHDRAHKWFRKEQVRGWGTCAVTQIGFVRISSHPSIRGGVSTREAFEKMREIVGMPTHSFWPEPPDGYLNEAFSRTIARTLTHGLVTDGYLATVAAFHGGKLATFDRQLVKTFAEVAILVD